MRRRRGRGRGRVGHRVLADGGQQRLHLGAGLGVDRVDRGVVGGPGRGQVRAGDQQRIAVAADPLVLVLGPVGLGVALVVALEAEAGRLQHARRRIAAGLRDQPRERLGDDLAVGPVDRLPQAVVGDGSLGDRRGRDHVVAGDADPVVVVLDHDDQRQLPGGRHRHALVEGAVVGAGVAGQGDRDVVATLQLDRVGVAECDRQRGADDPGRREVDARVERVHVAAVAAAEPGRALEDLGQQRPRVGPLDESVAVVAVGRDERVGRPQDAGHPGRDRLLADPGVELAVDLAGRDALEAGEVELADPGHPAVAVDRRGRAHAGTSSSSMTLPAGSRT